MTKKFPSQNKYKLQTSGEISTIVSPGRAFILDLLCKSVAKIKAAKLEKGFKASAQSKKLCIENKSKYLNSKVKIEKELKTWMRILRTLK